MNEQRQKLYHELDEKIGKTPLVEYTGEVPNGNKIWIKEIKRQVSPSFFNLS